MCTPHALLFPTLSTRLSPSFPSLYHLSPLFITFFPLFFAFFPFFFSFFSSSLVLLALASLLITHSSTPSSLCKANTPVPSFILAYLITPVLLSWTPPRTSLTATCSGSCSRWATLTADPRGSRYSLSDAFQPALFHTNCMSFFSCPFTVCLSPSSSFLLCHCALPDCSPLSYLARPVSLFVCSVGSRSLSLTHTFRPSASGLFFSHLPSSSSSSFPSCHLSSFVPSFVTCILCFLPLSLAAPYPLFLSHPLPGCLLRQALL